MRAFWFGVLLVLLASAGGAQEEWAGLVQGVDGQPVGDAQVQLVYREVGELWPPPDPARRFAPLATDAEGRFRFKPEGTSISTQAAAALALTPEGVGRSAGVDETIVEPVTGLLLGWIVTIQPWQTASGIVTGPDGEPIEGATVSLRQLEVDTVKLDGRRARDIWILADVTDDLPPLRPASSANRQLPWPVDWPVPAATTGADGRWTIDRCPSQGAEFNVTAPGWTAARFEVPAGDGYVAEPVELRPQGSVRGRLLDDAGQPLAGLHIKPGHYLSSNARAVVTDAEGRFELRDLTAGERQIVGESLDSDWFVEPRTVTITGGEVTEIGDLVASRARPLVVSVTNGETGEPVPEVVITGLVGDMQFGLGETHRTGPDGRMVLRLPMSLRGRVYVSATPSGGWLAANGESSAYQSVELTDDAAPLTATFALYPTRAASGRLLDEAGAPLADHQISVGRRDALPLYTRSAADGTFTFRALLARGSATLVVREPSNYQRYEAAIELADVPDTDWQLVVPVVARATLRGRVVDAAGTPLAGASVTIGGTDPDLPVRATGQSAEDGTFVVDLPAGPLYSASAYRDGYERTRPRPLAPGATDFGDIVLQGLAGQLSGRVVDAAGAPVGGALVWVGGRSEPVEATHYGAFTIARLAPGSVTLFATDGVAAVGQLEAAPDGPPVTITVAPLPAPDADADHAAAVELLHELVQLDEGMDWWRKGEPIEWLARIEPADALTVVAHLPAAARAPVLLRVWPELARAVPAAARAQVDILDALTPAQAAAGRLLLALGLLEAGDAAGAGAVAAAAQLPPAAAPSLRALAALVAVRLELPGAAEQWAAAAAALPAPGAERDDEALMALASLVGERSELLADLPGHAAYGPARQGLQLAALARWRPDLAAPLYVEWRRGPDPLPPGQRATRAARELPLVSLEALPPAERMAWVDQLPAPWADELRPVAILLSDTPLDIVAYLGREPLPVALRPLAAYVLPDLLRPIVRAHTARRNGHLGAPLADLLAPGVIWAPLLDSWGQDPLAPRPGAPSLAQVWDTAVPGRTLPGLATIDLERTMALLALGPPNADRATVMMSVVEALASPPPDRWRRAWAGAPDPMWRGFLGAVAGE